MAARDYAKAGGPKFGQIDHAWCWADESGRVGSVGEDGVFQVFVTGR
jgi:hypothetical protein